jgi:hypothetical protein
VRNVLATGLLLAGAAACGHEAPRRSPVEITVVNRTDHEVVVTPWRGADEVTVPARGSVPVRASAPPQPWAFRVAGPGGRDPHTTELWLRGSRSVLVTDAGATPDGFRDGSDLDARTTR